MNRATLLENEEVLEGKKAIPERKQAIPEFNKALPEVNKASLKGKQAILTGNRAILDHARLLEQFAERCGQSGAMHWLGYFLGGAGAQWKRPCIVLFLHPGADTQALEIADLKAAVLFYELSTFGFKTGAFSTDDWEGLRTVIAPPALRNFFAARAAEALIERGAQVVLTTYRGSASDEPEAGPLLRRTETLWAEHKREVRKQRLRLEDTYEATLAKFGKRTRIHLRSYRKRLLEFMDCEFLADALPVLHEADLIALNQASLNPVAAAECCRRYRASRDLDGGFLIALRGPNGQLLSTVGGWRQGDTTVMHHQMNVAGFEKHSIGTVMRSFFLESEVARGTRNVIFYHGTDHSISHAFEAETARDLVIRRRSVRAYLLCKLARRLVSSRHYSEVHYFGGSTTFFAAVLASDQLQCYPSGRNPGKRQPWTINSPAETA